MSFTVWCKMLLGVLKNSSAMMGVLDLGGGSVQITFHSKVDSVCNFLLLSILSAPFLASRSWALHCVEDCFVCSYIFVLCLSALTLLFGDWKSRIEMTVKIFLGNLNCACLEKWQVSIRLAVAVGGAPDAEFSDLAGSESVLDPETLDPTRSKSRPIPETDPRNPLDIPPDLDPVHS